MTSKDLSKIMYIEDEPDILTIAQIALEEIGGFKLKCCHSGTEALNQAQHFNPDIFLIDVMMPQMDGPTTLKELRKMPQFNRTPVIFMTAKTQANEVSEYIAMGAAGVITKPFDPVLLAEHIRTIWNKDHDT
jgi:two-component system OmpR family response regulator